MAAGRFLTNRRKAKGWRRSPSQYEENCAEEILEREVIEEYIAVRNPMEERGHLEGGARCRGEGCPARNKCLRYTDMENRDSDYLRGIPFDENGCECFLAVKIMNQLPNDIKRLFKRRKHKKGKK